MKFFFECVSCYGTPEESRSLVSPASPSGPAEDVFSGGGRRLVRRSRQSSRMGLGDWKPSLHAISEDIVVAPAKARAAEQMARAASANRSRGRCGAPATQAHSRGRGDSYGHDPMPAIVPPFAPTPFLF